MASNRDKSAADLNETIMRANNCKFKIINTTI